MENLKTDNVTDMRNMFYSCSGLTSLDVSGFDTSNVTDMRAMFMYCYGLTSLDVSGFDTSNVTDMRCMFGDCSGLTNLDVSNFNTSKVTDMSWMFAGCSGLTTLDLSDFDTSNVTDMSWMFQFCSGLTTLDLSGFDTSNVTNMREMFWDCTSLNSLDLSSFNTSNVTNMFCMFYVWGPSSNLTTIYADEAKWSTANVTDSGGMFSGCTSLVGGNGTVYDANHTDAEYARIDKPGQPGYFTAKEMEPIETVDFGTDINEETDLDGNVIGDIYYVISGGDGSYNAAEGCIVVTTPTEDSFIEGQDIFGEDFKAGFTGIVFKVPAGKGTVKVVAQTTGGMLLKVKIGDNDPIEMELEGKLTVTIPYNVSVPTYVYIYAGSNNTLARSNRAGETNGELKLYGIEVTQDETGIDAVHSSQFRVQSYYTLDGRKLDGVPAKKGIYIVNGRKIVVK